MSLVEGAYDLANVPGRENQGQLSTVCFEEQMVYRRGAWFPHVAFEEGASVQIYSQIVYASVL